MNKGRNKLDKFNTDNSKRKFFNLRNKILALLIPALVATGGGVNTSCTDNKSRDNISSKSKESGDIQYASTASMEEDIKLDLQEYQIKNIITDPIYPDMLVSNEPDFYTSNNISDISADEILGFAPGVHSGQSIKEAMYMQNFSKLSKKDYETMFKGIKYVKQGAIGNCYVIVAVKNLARSKYFDTLMMTSIEKANDSSFYVYLPLGEPFGEQIKITKDDLKATKIGGSIGYKILEAGFTKYLLYKKGVIHNKNTVLTDELIKKTVKGNPGDAMQTLLGPKSYYNECLRNNKESRDAIVNYLSQYNPKILQSLSVITASKPGKTDQNSFDVGGKTLYYNHAYSIYGIEKDGFMIKYITLENPWNNENKEGGSKVKLTLSEFLNSVSFVNIGHITDNFLNYNTTPDEVVVVDRRDRSS